jgi:hypothetical protein
MDFSIIFILRKIIALINKGKYSFDKWLDEKERKINLRKLMEEANSYLKWKDYAKELDSLEGKNKWKETMESGLYDYKGIKSLVKTLKKKMEFKDIRGLVHYVRVNLMKNLYSTLNPALYQSTYHGTKYLIEEYEKEMMKSIEFIATFNEKIFPLHKKLEFFSETRHSYGRTALLLSGGSTLGMYHIGVIKTLYEQNLMPRIICGSSAGSMIAAMVCTEPYENVPNLIERELKQGPFEYKIRENSIWVNLLRFIMSGALFDIEAVGRFLRDSIGDITFQEAFDKTAWILNITVTGYKEHDNHRLLNYLTAPNVLIWSEKLIGFSNPDHCIF